MIIVKTNLIAILLFLSTGNLTFAQQNIKVYSEETKEGIAIYGDNHEYCPVTVQVKKNGVLVKVVHKITQGQIIANSGNTGWSSGPHLHLVVFLEMGKNRETIPTQFKIGDGTVSELLKKKETYLPDY